MKSPQYDIPCPHEAGTTPHDEVAADHHPLTRGAVLDLLQTAHALALAHRGGQCPGVAVELSSIQVRLHQAIAGMVCPRPGDGLVRAKMEQLDSTFVDWLADPDTARTLPVAENDAIAVAIFDLLGI